MNFYHAASLGALAIGILGTSGTAWAADAAQAAATAPVAATETATPDTNEVVPTEIIVTAQRRNERNIEVPMTVTSLSGDALETANIVDTGDLPRLVPGLNFVNNGGYTAITMRGIGSFQRSPGSANNVAIYLDGAYMPSKLAGIFELPDISDIQVLKGPQGTLYGLNATAGAILINTLDPSFDTAMKFTVGYGSHNDKYARFFVNAPLVDDKLAVSLAGSYQDRGAFLTNVVTGQKQGGVNSGLLRAKLLFTPSETTEFILTASYSRRKDEDQANAAFPAGRTAGSNGFSLKPDAITTTEPRKFSSRITDSYLINEAYRVSLEANVETDIGQFQSITSYTSSQSPSYIDGSFTDAPGVFYAFEQPNKTFTQELNFVSERMGAFQFLGGASYIRDRAGFQPLLVYFGALTSPNPILAIDYDVIDTSLAGYAEADVKITDRLSFTAGTRYTRSTNKYYGSNTVDLYPLVASATFGQLTPRAALKFKLSDTAQVYASYSKGFKGGTFPHSTFGTTPVRPETVDGYEVGFKTDIDRVFSIAVAGFYQTYKDVQLEIASPNPSSPLVLSASLTNAGGAEVYGADIDVTLRPVTGLTLSAKAEYLHTKITDFPNAFVQAPLPIGSCPVASLPAGCGRVGQLLDVSGFKLKNAPDWTASFSADYVLTPSIGDITLSANAYYTSSFFWDTGNFYKEPSYVLVGGRIAWQPFNDNLQLAVWGKNLLGEDYATGYNDSVGGIYWAMGRTFGVEGSFKF